MHKRLLQAAWIAPIDQPPIRDGAIVFTDRIVEVGPAAQLHRSHPDAVAEDLGQTCILPALVNAHAHLELSDLTPGQPPRSFTDWLLRLAPAAVSGDVAQSNVRAAVERAAAACIKFGVGTVGDITTQPDVVRRCLAGLPLRVVSYGEVRGMCARRHLLEPRLSAAGDCSAASEHLFPAISPHAPYSIDGQGYERCLHVARERQLALATHLAETPYEGEFLAHHTGPFRKLWEAIGGWDDSPPRFDGGPIRFAQSVGLLDDPTLLAHVNYADNAELDILSGGRASVVYCPRTHAYFGHPPHRWREMVARGINVALGTDSTASSPDLNLLDDLRLLHGIAPEVPACDLWEMITIRGARALALGEAVGTLTGGKWADLTVFPCTETDPLTHLLRDDVLPSRLYVGGQQVNG